MGRKWRRDPEKERSWRRTFQDWRRSGLSVREFCDWQSLSEASFYAWRRELTKRDREAEGFGAPKKPVRRPVEQNGVAATRPGMFLPVRVVTETATPVTSARPGIEVHLPSGVRLLVPTGCDRQILVDVLSALETRSC